MSEQRTERQELHDDLFTMRQLVEDLEQALLLAQSRTCELEQLLGVEPTLVRVAGGWAKAEPLH